MIGPMAKPVRPVRGKPNRPTQTEKPKKASSGNDLAVTGGRLHESWTGVIRGVIEIDVPTLHQELKDALVLKKPYSASRVIEALDHVQEHIRQAELLSARARRDYEVYKEAHESWLEVKKSAARLSLEEEKKQGNLKKTITNDMILDTVRSTWEQEYVERVTKLKDFQSAVHYVERLAQDWRGRPGTLSDLASQVRSMGPQRARSE